MTFSDFIPMIASHLGLAPATMVFLIFCVNQGAKIIGRLIPNDAIGWQGTLRNLCAIIGADPSSRVTSGVTVQDVAAASLTTPPITEKVEAATDVPIEPAKP